MQRKDDTRTTNLSNLNLEGSLRVPEVCFVMFNGLISSIETIPAAVAVPMSPLESLFSFDYAYDITLVTASEYF